MTQNSHRSQLSKPSTFLHLLTQTLLLFTASSTLYATLLSHFVTLSLQPETASAALILGIVTALFPIRSLLFNLPQTSTQSHSQYPSPPHSQSIPISHLIVLLFAGAIFFQTTTWILVEQNSKIFVTNPSNWGDMSMHLSYINTFASGKPFWPENPFLTKVPLHFPVGIDLFNALFVSNRLDFIPVIVTTAILSGVLTLYTLYRFGSTFVILGFLFNGGLTAFKHLHPFHWVNFQSEIAWRNIFITNFTPMRGFQYAFPCALFLLYVWRDAYLTKPLSQSNNPASNDTSTPLDINPPTATPTSTQCPPWIQVLLYSTLPFFHFHTFLFLSFLLLVWMLFSTHKRYFLRIVLCSVPIATYLISLITNLTSPLSYSSALIRWLPGWMQNTKPFFAFWFENFGILPLLLVYALYRQLFHKNADTSSHDQTDTSASTSTAFSLLYLPAIILFLTCCFICFAPSAWDNQILMLWPYLVVLPFIQSKAIQNLPKWSRPILCCLLFFSGAYSVASSFLITKPAQVTTRTALEIQNQIQSKLLFNRTFLIAPVHNHPVLLTGNKATLGYPGHVWTHGFDYKPTETLVESVYRGQGDWYDSLQKLGATYLFWGDIEKQRYPHSPRAWENHFPVVASGKWGAIYQVAP